ncbi:LLM class flavin-dependent oxidoreductase [Symbioplanes lichenis]|uniref:LLM class flavin-dependent oxidoreductase n=1 Tax=Symbioplanes lichenis TaxID=1629072 RepID=UPI002739B115|nr:LLM class flavin-dependent oxidoreductase [Actinoplanes lichenis]
MVEFSLQVQPESAGEWVETARRAEAAGFDALLVSDHPGSGAAPFVALAAAAAVTETIKLGSYVVNAGVREPMLLAADVATLDLISGGRAILGLGAGHTPVEWEAVGRVRPDVRGRVDRCIAVTEATTRLLAGEKVTWDGAGLTLRDAELTKPRPVAGKVPLLMGTSNSRLLRWAGEHADIVGLSGLGRTREDGHSHDARWRLDQVDAQVALAREGGAATLEALVQKVQPDLGEWTDDLNMTEDELRQVPFLLIGDEAELLAAVRRNRERWGITRYAVRREALDTLGPILPKLRAA